MTIEELESIKSNKRWTVTFKDFYSRYFFILFPFGIVIIGATMVMSAFKNDITNLKVASILILVIGFFLFVFVLKRLYQSQIFYSFQIQNLSKEKVDLALKYAKLNNIKYHKLGYYSATTNVSWLSWGEQITVIINENEILLNSRPAGSIFSFQPITIFKDKKNITMIIKQLQLSKIKD